MLVFGCRCVLMDCVCAVWVCGSARAWGLMGEALGLNYDTRLYALLAHGAIDECHRLQVRAQALKSAHIDGDVARAGDRGSSCVPDRRGGDPPISPLPSLDRVQPPSEIW